MTLPDPARIRERAADAAYALGWKVVRRMPERAARTLFASLADRAWRQRGRGVRQLEKNLCRVLGKEAVDEEVRLLSRRAMRSYMRYWMEVFRLPEISRERILNDMIVSGHERVFATLDAGRGVVLALPHMGNYEQAGAWVTLHGYSFTTVAERLRPESLFDRFLAFRESLGFEVLPLGGGSTGAMAFGTLARRLRAGRLVALVADRDLTAGGLEVEFFGRPARLPAGPAALAVQTGAALFPVTLWYEGDKWAARVHEEIPVPDTGDRKEKVRAMTQRLALAFQEGIAEHPEDWHMLQKVWVEDLS
ncbi:phosphatidylinositol mannoside acyltransferase [Thermomonospora catenispora]|uniref:phosphatidylinositol mannoside acyltransferase n=1 Tax=Thermomonospora catenispora TaxID=2493090 RepID=UPI0015883958|nr:phosphatidylinositol mannoside acyltransferase [Thermomonospora catenispora]